MSRSARPTVTSRCFWWPRCRHTETGTDPEDVAARMEGHYDAEHDEDVRRVTGR